MILLSHKEEPAKYIYTPPPLFRNDTERRKYWELEKQRWIEGHNGLTGKHYFYLSQCKIKHGTSGRLIRPIYRDVDQWIFEAIDKAIAEEHDLGIIKRREIGLTSIGAGCLPNYYMRVFPGSTSIMTSCDKPRIFRAFEDKTAIVYDNLVNDIRPIQNKRNQTKETVYLKTRLNIINEEGDKEVRYSDVFCADTVSKPNAFSSIRCKYGFYDEFALHKKREALIGSSKACFMDGPHKNGFLLWGGTVEDGVENETLVELKKIVGDSKNSNTLIFFVEAWMGLFMSENGVSDKQKGIDWVEKERERLMKMESKEQYLAFVKNYPLTLDEALEMSSTGIFPAEVVDTINRQGKAITSGQSPVGRHKIFNDSGAVRAEPDQLEGKFYVLEHPRANMTYISGTDPIPFGDAHISDGSDFAITIKCRETDAYVAYYAERSMDTDIVINNAILLQDYYNGAVTMVEKNRGAVMIEKYKDLGRLDLLASKPNALGASKSKLRFNKGYYKDDKMSQLGNDLLIKYLISHADTLWFQRQIDELMGYLISNTDLVDAMVSCEIYDANLVKKGAKHTVKKTHREIRTVERDHTGKTVVVYRKVEY